MVTIGTRHALLGENADAQKLQARLTLATCSVNLAPVSGMGPNGGGPSQSDHELCHRKGPEKLQCEVQSPGSCRTTGAILSSDVSNLCVRPGYPCMAKLKIIILKLKQEKPEDRTCTSSPLILPLALFNPFHGSCRSS